MDCIECKSSNPDDNRFCGQCGAELGRTLEETVRKKFRDRFNDNYSLVRSFETPLASRFRASARSPRKVKKYITA